LYGMDGEQEKGNSDEFIHVKQDKEKQVYT